MHHPPRSSVSALSALWIERKACAQDDAFEPSPSLDTKRVRAGAGEISAHFDWQSIADSKHVISTGRRMRMNVSALSAGGERDDVTGRLPCRPWPPRGALHREQLPIQWFFPQATGPPRE